MKSFSHRARAIVITAALLSLVRPGPADISITILAQGGDPAPYAGAGLALSAGGFLPQLAETLITNSGEVAFPAGLAGPGVTDDNAQILLAGRPGAFRLLAREGEPAPGLPTDVVFDLFSPTSMTESGRVLFIAQIRGPGVAGFNNYGLWLETDPPGGTPIHILDAISQAPGMPAGITCRPGSVDASLGDTHRVALPATLAGTGITTTNDTILYITALGDPSTITPLARENDQIPGQPAGVLYGDLTAPSWTPQGNLIVRTILRGPGITTANDGAYLLFMQGAGNPQIILREGSPIPGAGGGADAATLFIPLQTNGRELGFFARFSASPSTLSTLCVGPLDGSGPYRTLGFTGTPAPGLDPGFTFVTPDLSKFLFNSHQRGVFVADVDGPGVTNTNDKVLYSEGPAARGSPLLLAREAESAPGTPAGVTFADLGGVFNSVAINDRDQTAIFATLQGAGVTTDSDNGLWVVGADDTALQLVAREGTPLTLGLGDTRTVRVLGYRIVTNGTFPWRRWFNDRGEIILPVFFTDNSGALLRVTVDPRCPADFNSDGASSLQDLFDFLTAWFSGNPSADINGVGGVTLQDLFDFLTAWFAGCP